MKETIDITLCTTKQEAVRIARAGAKKMLGELSHAGVGGYKMLSTNRLPLDVQNVFLVKTPKHR